MSGAGRTLKLVSGDHSVVLAPDRGGSILAYRSIRGGASLDWLVPGDATRVSCFPMVPFCSRIRNGRFAFGGRALSLSPNDPPGRHPIHGHGWRRAWRIVAAAADRATIEYLHRPDEWPWSYLARQRMTLKGAELALTLSVENRGCEPMPLGFGVHPFFVRSPQVEVRADVDVVWHLDAELLPDRAEPLAGNHPLRAGWSIGDGAVDAVFGGWRRELLISWPERGAHVRLTATPPLEHLVIYGTAGGEFLCVEPVSNVPDAFNLSPGRVVRPFQILAPGSTIEATVTFEPGFDPPSARCAIR